MVRWKQDANENIVNIFITTYLCDTIQSRMLTLGPQCIASYQQTVRSHRHFVYTRADASKMARTIGRTGFIGTHHAENQEITIIAQISRDAFFLVSGEATTNAMPRFVRKAQQWENNHRFQRDRSYTLDSKCFLVTGTVTDCVPDLPKCELLLFVFDCSQI